MAEQEEDGGSWWSAGWKAVATVADKVAQAYKEDLGEFVGAVAEDTGKAVEEVGRSEWVATAATNVASLVDAIVEDDSSKVQVLPTSRLEAKLAELQRDIGTYCTNPPDEGFADFCATFDVAAREPQIAALLAASPLLQSNHAKLVPVVVSYQDFWRRYLFRELRLREREQERERLIFKASSVSAGEEEMPWEEDEATSTPATGSSASTPAKQATDNTLAVASTPTSANAVTSHNLVVEKSAVESTAAPFAAAAAATRVDPSQSLSADFSPIALSTAKSSFDSPSLVVTGAPPVIDDWDSPLDSNEIFTKTTESTPAKAVGTPIAASTPVAPTPPTTPAVAASPVVDDTKADDWTDWE